MEQRDLLRLALVGDLEIVRGQPGNGLAGSVERLYTLKGDVVRAGIERLTGIRMPVFPKRRFQDGAGDAYRSWRVSKAFCRRLFLRQWEERLSAAWDPQSERTSGNAVPSGR